MVFGFVIKRVLTICEEWQRFLPTAPSTGAGIDRMNLFGLPLSGATYCPAKGHSSMSFQERNPQIPSRKSLDLADPAIFVFQLVPKSFAVNPEDLRCPRFVAAYACQDRPDVGGFFLGQGSEWDRPRHD